MSREMRHSGIEWIGEIPKEWKICQLKRLLSFQNGQDYKHVESDSGYPVYGSGGIFKYSTAYLYDGESVLFGRKGTIDNPLYVKGKFWTVDTMYYAIPLGGNHSKFLYYFATLLPFDKYQTSTALPSMTQTLLGNMNVVFPPLSEQQKIADYLDKVCGEVDEMIALQEQMIEELKAYKQSVITEAVTKGLNPDVPMKDSGIDWIGAVPKHWGKDKIIRIFNLIGSGTTPSSSDNDAYDGHLNWIQSGDINGGDLYESKNKISEKTLAKYSALTMYDAPFIIIAMYGASVGNISISHINGCVNQACCVMSKTKQDFIYIYYVIKSAKDFLIYKAVGGGQPNISQSTLKQLWLPVPPLSEQQTIASYLDTKCAEIDALIAIKQAKIDELKDYKKSVIYEYVTGKKEVV